MSNISDFSNYRLTELNPIDKFSFSRSARSQVSQYQFIPNVYANSARVRRTWSFELWTHVCIRRRGGGGTPGS